MHGLAVTEDGRLLAGSVVGQTLSEVDRQTGEVEVLIDPPKGMADDIAIGSDGTLVWTSFLAGTLRARTREGEIVTVAEDFEIPAAANFGPQGKLYVVDTALGQLFRVDSENGDKTKIAQLEPSLDNLAIGNDGTIYVSNMADNSIQQVDPETGEARTLVESELAATAGLALVGDTLYVADIFALS